MSTSAYRRLRSLVNTATPATTRSTKTHKPTATTNAVASAADVSPTPSDPTDEPKERWLREIVTKFKESSDSSRFRRQDVRIYEKTVLRLAAAHKFSYIEEILEYQKQFNNITHEGFVSRLIKLYGKAGMFDHARKLFDEMPQLNCPRTVMSFGALLGASVSCKKFDEITQLLADLPDKLSIKPDIVCYNTLIKAHCKQGLFDSALSVIDKIEETGLNPNVVSFNTLINAFSENGKLAEAEKVWALMEAKNVVPDVISYNQMLRALVASNRLPDAVKLFEEMKSKGIKPDTISFNALIKGFHDEGNLEEARTWHEEMRKESCNPDRYTYNLLVQLACSKCDFVYGFELCKESIKKGCNLNPSNLQLVVDGLVKDYKMAEAKELVHLGKSTKSVRYEVELPSAKE